MSTIDLAIVGATGAVGEVIIELLASRNFPVGEIYLLASERTAGTSLKVGKKNVLVSELKAFDFAIAKLAIFVATDSVSREFIPKAQAAGCLVIDNSQEFAAEAPLVLPSVNDVIFQAKPEFVVNPDSSALLLATVLKPLINELGIEQVSATVLNSVSREGKKGVSELAGQTTSLLNSRGAESKVFAKQIAFNVLPSVGDIDESGHTSAEWMVFNQVKRLLNEPSLNLEVSCLRAPMFYCDSINVSIQFQQAVDLAVVNELWSKNDQIKLVETQESSQLPTPVTDGAGNELILISRVRRGLSSDKSLNFCLVADNVRKSAAFNTILIAEELIKSYL